MRLMMLLHVLRGMMGRVVVWRLPVRWEGVTQVDGGSCQTWEKSGRRGSDWTDGGEASDVQNGLDVHLLASEQQLRSRTEDSFGKELGQLARVSRGGSSRDPGNLEASKLGREEDGVVSRWN
ncbi:hypothetical protein TWF481_008301 [Arthrobotrys musiformis]|uniref:Secreted protein n=1 Tax=Arthrobotrys musiformis TaxID=47236 RepID=A0AAV9W8Q8_9PEZI